MLRLLRAPEVSTASVVSDQVVRSELRTEVCRRMRVLESSSIRGESEPSGNWLGLNGHQVLTTVSVGYPGA